MTTPDTETPAGLTAPPTSDAPRTEELTPDGSPSRRGFRQIVPIALLLAVGAVGAWLLLRDAPADTDEHGDEQGAAEVEFARGPNGGRLLEADSPEGLVLEVTIAEDGIPPEFRMYPTAGGRPVPPGDVDLTVILTRLGSVDTLRFEPGPGFLRSTTTVREPHSFAVEARARYGGQTALWTYESIEGRAPMANDVAERAGITIEQAGPATIREALRLPGEVALNAEREAHVVARFGGVVQSVSASQGDFVRAGQLLAVVESRELAGVADVYVRAVHRLEFAQSTFERERLLHERRISATRDFDAARHDLEESEIAVQVAEQSLVAAGIPRGRLRSLAAEPSGSVSGGRVRSPLASVTRVEVRAPISGQVLTRDVSVGESVSEVQTLFTVADLSTVWVEVTVAPRALARVRAGQAVTVRSAETETEAEGRIQFVGAVVGEDTRAARARVVLPNPGGRWRPGQSVDVDVATATYRVPLAVRTAALQDFRDSRVVYARHDGQFEVRMLELGVSDSTWTEVLGGLRVGEPYAATNSFIVKAEIGKAGATHDH